MSEFRKEIKKVIKKLNNTYNTSIEDILKEIERPLEIFSMNLNKEIILELSNISKTLNDKNPNPFLKYDKSFLYQMIDLFNNIKKSKITEDIIIYLFSKDNIEPIINSIYNIYKNNININDKNIIIYLKKIIDFLKDISNINQKLFLEYFIISYKDNDLDEFFKYFSKSKITRDFLYDCEQSILLLFPGEENFNNFLGLINNTIDDMNQQLSDNSFIYIIEEIQKLLYIFKNKIFLISNSMIKLIVNIFKINENIKNDGNNKAVCNLLRYCFDRIVFIYSENTFTNLTDNKKKFKYNQVFMNFLLEIYNELINQKLKFSYTSFLMELFLGIDNIGIGTKKLVWLINETKYPQIVLQSLIDLKDFNLLSLYFSKILFLSVPNNEYYYMPEYDIKFFFSKLDSILNSKIEEENEKMFDIISSQIINLININKINIKNDIIDILLSKYSIINIFLLIINSNNYTNQIKNKLIHFLENIFNINNNNIKYTLNIPISDKLDIEKNFNINDINSYGIKYKINLLSLKYDNNITEYTNKLTLVINNMKYYLENKLIFEFILSSDIILKSFLTESHFNFINEISKEIISKINNILIQASKILLNNECFDLVIKFVFQIINFNYKFNQKSFKFKKQKSSIIIIEEDIMKLIFKNIFTQINDYSLKEKLIYKICLNENEIVHNSNIKKKEYILETPFFSILTLKILYEIEDFKSILYLYNLLIEIINYSNINIKLLSQFNLISFINKFVIDIYINKLEIKQNDNTYEECFNKGILLLNLLLKYATQSLLMKYLSTIFNMFFETIYENKNNNYRYKEIILKLLSLLKENISLPSIQKQNYQFLSLSKKSFSNPFIYNIFYINNLRTNEAILHYNVDIRINTYNTIGNFYIANFINEKNNQSLFIYINNKKQLVVGEKLLNKNQVNELDIFDNINDCILNDNKFHNISIIIDLEIKNIKILIDYKKINPRSHNINYNNFNFENFSLIIGYEYDAVDSFKDNDNDAASIIDVSNILVINYLNDVDNYILNTKKEEIKKRYELDNILDYLFIEKKEYYYKFVLAEICFNLNNIKFMNSNKIINNSCSDIFNKYILKNNQIIQKYISRIEFVNPFRNINIKLQMASLNNNIENYYSANYIFMIQNINKVVLQNMFCENCNIFSSSSNYFFIDFLIGFLYDIDKRREYIYNDNNNNKLKNDNNIILLEDDEYINKYILLILEIILMIPNEKIKKFFLYENNYIDIKLKYFFKRNIYLLNNKIFLNKLFDLLKNKKLDLLIFINEIFIDIIIFSLLCVENQNIIIINIKQLLEEKKEEKTKIKSRKNLEQDKTESDEVINPLLCKLLEKLYNIVLYYQLSIEEIKYYNNQKQIDIIVNCILIIYEKIDKKISNKYENKISDLSMNVINICSKMQESVQTHNIKAFLEKYKNILPINNIFLDNYGINYQIELVTKSLTKFLAKLMMNQRNSENNKSEDNLINDVNNKDIKIDLNQIYYLNQKDDINDINDNDYDLNDNDNIDLVENDDQNSTNNIYNIYNIKKCYFCSYLYTFFKINLDSIYDEMKYEKCKNIFYRHIFLNFIELRPKLGINNYAWYLSECESSHRIQNKFFIKENKIQVEKESNPKLKNKSYLFSYKYDNKLDTYNKIVMQLHRIFIYDNISTDHHFINLFNNNINNTSNNNNIILLQNCLLINKIHKTLSLLLIYSDYLLIITNICIDNENKVHVAVNEMNMNAWCITYEEYVSELENYIKNNENDVTKKFFDEKEKNNIDNNEFGYNRSFKFRIKKINFSEINEMHKVSFLQIQNSIEIITNKGKSFFLCFNIERRDIVFFTIINNITNIKKKKKSISKKIQVNSDEYFYMKFCPKHYIDIIKDNNIFSLIGKKIINNNKKIKNNKNDIYRKAIVEKNIFLNEVNGLWLKNRISNFDYLMLLNTFAGRSLINLSQYYIFPLILQNFDHRILNLINRKMFRDLSIPIFACYPSSKNDLSQLEVKKFELNEIGDKYHSGIFYSTHAFVSYYLIRQHPFTEVHLEIQGGIFDSADRLFIGTKELSSLEDKNQELIPLLFTLPELYINTNNFNFGKMLNNSNKEISNVVNDFILPKWSEDDPRKFTLVFKKVLESKKISQNLNYWIDLIFGYKMFGIEAIKSYNTYRKACYELSNEDIELMNQDGQLLSILLEKQELGYMGKQLFKKQHKKKEVITDEFQENENIFFDTNMKLRNIKYIKINNKDYEQNNNKILKINDLMIETNNDYINNTINNKNLYHQGGISSLKTIMNALSSEYNSNNKNYNLIKLTNLFEKECKFNTLMKKSIYLGDSINNIVLEYNKRIIKINYNFNNDNTCSYYFLNEIGNISIIVANQKGTKLYIGFDNGNILVYKIIIIDNVNIIPHDENYIYPFKNIFPSNNENNNNSRRKLNGSFKTKKSDNTNKTNIKNNNNLFEFIIFEKVKNNSFTINNPHVPQKIKKLCLDEENNILIASTSFNMIYIISLNHNFKLMHVVPYCTKEYYNYQCKIKDIISLNNNGDFIIYSSLTVHLFSINGIPICDLNLLDTAHNHITNITYCVPVFLFEVILFTGHKNGSIIIWKIKNKNKFDNANDRISSIFNTNIAKLFLPEYNFGYSFNFDLNKLKDFELRRTFDVVNQIKVDMNFPIKYMKMSNDMSYMLIINEKKNIFILGNFENENNNINVNNNNNNANNKKKKMLCSWCNNEIIDCYYRATYITSLSNIENENNDFEVIDKIDIFNINEDEENNKKEDEKKKESNKKNKNYTYICEECKQKIVQTENYLYNY